MICITNVGDWTACDFLSSVQCHKCDSLEVFLLRVTARILSRPCWEFVTMFLFTFVFVWVGGGGKSLHCPRSPSSRYIACFSRFFQHRHFFLSPWCPFTEVFLFYFRGNGLERRSAWGLNAWKVFFIQLIVKDFSCVIDSWCCKSDHPLV